ncbi:MAG: HEAT repeat domain-containing protein [Saprospiraceae bacterium]|nr:HEAT repeat domain-containing protein [Saprospiraceae bacterium]
MVNDKNTDLIIRYLMGDLSQREMRALEESMDLDPALKKEMDQYREVINKWQSTPLRSTPVKQIDRFNEWLDTQVSPREKITKTRTLNWWKYAAAASFLILISFLMLPQIFNDGKETNTQAQKEQLLQLVSAQNTTSRIKGINQYQSEPVVDPDVRDVFIRVLENDKSTNVRLAALEALSGLSQDPQVKTALIRILENDHEPAIQMAIINILVKWKDSTVKGTLQELLDKEEVPEDVKEEAFLGVTRL